MVDSFCTIEGVCIHIKLPVFVITILLWNAILSCQKERKYMYEIVAVQE